MWKSAYVGVYQLLDWKMQGETLKFLLGVLGRTGDDLINFKINSGYNCI